MPLEYHKGEILKTGPPLMSNGGLIVIPAGAQQKAGIQGRGPGCRFRGRDAETEFRAPASPALKRRSAAGMLLGTRPIGRWR